MLPQGGGEQPALSSLNPLRLAAARGITKSCPGQAKNNVKLNGWKPVNEKPSKKELQYVVLERDSTLKPTHWSLEKLVQRLLETEAHQVPPDEETVAAQLPSG